MKPKDEAVKPEDKLPLPGKEYEEHPIPSSTGDKSYREPGTRPFTIRHKDHDADDSVPRLPNDHDESPDSQQSGPREVIKQAYKDIMQGQVDTDLREQRGVEKTVNEPLKPAPEMPQKHGRT
jgi:hypothetical protein